ncbi:MAG: tRNA (N(6)-L-threonylcarbamoyladenosine(37)-C(2))-methylthiotransferase MtaB [Deltaproteobacteria bacterium]|nr:tRNA (N(6)-L-threonylcarbamoyladenosine(37)-C(2))-methylthiotransferase MtaB [Deltaproteobacteria bacterium]
MRVAFTTLGCKANWVDTESVIQMCKGVGAEIVAFDDEADIYVVNTCTVTSVADQQSRQMLRRAKRRSPKAIVVATGCVGETSKELLLEIDEVDQVFGTSDREGLLEFIFNQLDVDSTAGEVQMPVENQSRARSFLKIQDGCNRRCSYCIVPTARGRSRSVSMEAVVEAAVKLSKHHHEIVLTGIDIGQYGSDLSNASLALLLDALLEEELDVRYRLSSLDPTLADDRIISLVRESGKICRHVHLSIQSCADGVLRVMGRGYGGDDVAKVIRRLVEQVPDIAVTGDVIAGFPGESEGDHRRTVEVLRSLPVAGLHIFPFSPRYGTRAYTLDGQVDKAEIKRRASELRELATSARQDFLMGIVGKTFDSIVTSKISSDENVVSAFSDNAVSVSLPAGVVEYGGIGKALIDRVDNLKVCGSWR